MMKGNILILKRNIQEERRKRKVKVKQVCDYLRRDRFYLSQMINPDLNTLIDISKAIGCSTADLVKGL